MFDTVNWLMDWGRYSPESRSMKQTQEALLLLQIVKIKQQSKLIEEMKKLSSKDG